MKIDWSAPLSFTIPPGTPYSNHGWMLIDLPMSDFNPDQVLQYRITEITDPALITDLSFINYEVLADGSVAHVTTIHEPNPETLLPDHLQHFEKLDPADTALFLAGYKYISKIECKAAYDKKFKSLTPTTNNLETSTLQSQLAEAQALLANPSYPTPNLSAISQASGISVHDLAQRVIAQNQSYQTSVNQLLGEMLAAELAIDNATTPLEVKNLGWA